MTGGVDAGLVPTPTMLGRAARRRTVSASRFTPTKMGDVVEHDVGFGGLGQGLKWQYRPSWVGLVVEGQTTGQVSMVPQIHRLVGQGDGLLVEGNRCRR